MFTSIVSNRPFFYKCAQEKGVVEVQQNKLFSLAVLESMPCTYIITPVFNDGFISSLKITPVSGWATRRYCIILLLI